MGGTLGNIPNSLHGVTSGSENNPQNNLSNTADDINPLNQDLQAPPQQIQGSQGQGQIIFRD